MSYYAYIRVSTEMQTQANQKHEIENYCKSHGISVKRWVSESVSGTIHVEKRALGKLLDRMRKGDCLICTELSRLGRNMLMIMGILNRCAEKGIAIRSIKDHFDLTDNINSKIIAFAFALAAEIERNLISQRTKEALDLRRQMGVRLGRPPGSSAKKAIFRRHQDEIIALKLKGTSLSQLATMYGIHRNTLRKYLKNATSQ